MKSRKEKKRKILILILISFFFPLLMYIYQEQYTTHSMRTKMSIETIFMD